MAESDMRGRVTTALRPLDAFAVENRVGVGTPDVNYIEGWIELKWLRSWPKKEETVVALEHFTKQQRIWLRRRWRAGGAVWLLLQCRRDWLLFTGPVAADVVGLVSKAELFEHAHVAWRSGLKNGELVSCLTTDLASLRS